MLDLDKKIIDEFEFHIGEKISIVEIKERLIYADFLDQKLKKYIDFDEILFASRHSSKDGRKIFTVHVSGNVDRADYGGKPYSLARPSPIRMKNYVMALKRRLSQKPEYQFTMEVTHHGPSEIITPSAFYEIGSTEEEWRDVEAGRVVAESLIEAINSPECDWNVAVGVGGTHYAPRQTEIILNTTFTFGHNFAKYTFDGLNEEIILSALKLSDTKYIIIDEKSTSSRIKTMLSDIEEKYEINILRSKDVKRNYLL